jgi:hypothetical protein
MGRASEDVESENGNWVLIILVAEPVPPAAGPGRNPAMSGFRLGGTQWVWVQACLRVHARSAYGCRRADAGARRGEAHWAPPHGTPWRHNSHPGSASMKMLLRDAVGAKQWEHLSRPWGEEHVDIWGE